MLLSFKIENFKSFRDQTILDLTTNPGDEHTDEQIIPYKGKGYKKTIVFYGANANGKSNFLDAFLALKFMVGRSKAILPNEYLPYSPFYFDADSLAKPTSFEIEFTVQDIRYRYSLSYIQNAVIKETLYYAPNGNMVMVFVRDGQVIKGRKDMEQFTTPALTARNKLFLTTAASFNNEPSNTVTNFLTNGLYLDKQNARFNVDPNVSVLDFQCFDAVLNDPKYKKFLLSLLQAADFNINDIKVEKNIIKTLLPTGPGESYNYNVYLAHDIKGEKKWLGINLESAGTRTILSISHLFYEAFISEKIFIVDELESSLHPSELSFLVKLFAEKSSKSQLLFTAHNPCIMEEKLLRRDEYYFVDKNNEGVSQLYSLADFSVRKDTSFAKEYYLGRYGAIPLIKDGFVS
jgi:AAA15 family ATPase/GTPase